MPPRLHSVGMTFGPAQFLWLAAALRLAARPADRRALDTLTGAFNRWFDVGISSADIAAVAEISGRSLLAEWAEYVGFREEDQANALTGMATSLSAHPTTFRNFIDQFLEKLPAEGSEDATDIDEDRRRGRHSFGVLVKPSGARPGSINFYKNWPCARKNRPCPPMPSPS